MIRKDKSSSKKNKILFLFIGIILLLFFFRGALNHIIDGIGYLFFPVQKSIYNTGNYFKETSYAVTEYKHILEENKRLKTENVKLDMAMEFNVTLAEENETLKKLLEMKGESQKDLRVARVNFRTPSNLYERFYIDLGKNDGMEKDMIVLSGKNLIGKIGKVYDDYSMVDMITGENFNISTLTENNMLGIAKGSNEGNGELYFEPNTFENTIKSGEKVYTSGISDIYPKGLYIGYISDINEDESEIFRSIKIKTDIDVLNLNEVLVIIPKEKE